MKPLRLLSIALVSIGLVGSLGGLAEAQRTGTIVGVVELTCTPDAAGTLVFIPGRSFVVITDSSGRFQLSSVPIGTYTVRIEPPGQGSHKDVPNVVVENNRTTDLHTVAIGDLNTDINNCGACGTVCSSANGIPSCNAGTCQITCNAGFGNCNATAADGCETNLQTSGTNCGACGTVCGPGSTCSAGTCQTTTSCPPGTTNCNNFCRDLQTDTNNCGACGNVCSLPHAISSCVTGVCRILTCAQGFSDCDGIAANGCETVGQCQ